MKKHGILRCASVAKNASIPVLIILLLVVCAGCGWTDWIFDLPNQYQVLSFNNHDIEIWERTGEMDDQLIVGNHVSSFSYNDRFVGVQRIVPDEPNYCTELERYSKEPEYYIVDTEKQCTYGPFDEAEYEDQCNNMGITDLCEWIKTHPMPDGAYYIGDER